MAIDTGSEGSPFAKAWLARLKASPALRYGFRLGLAALILAAPQRARLTWWPRWCDWLRWSWLSVDRPLHEPRWLDRRILALAVRRLAAEPEEEGRLLLLQLVMQFAYAFESGWYPDFADPVVRRNREILHYLFNFPIFIDSLARQDRIVGFIRRLYADLEKLHGEPLETEIRAEIAARVRTLLVENDWLPTTP